MSWLKKNELEIKRSVTELRESIKNNWTSTGQELGKELRHFWQSSISRPASPARSPISTPVRETAPASLMRHLSQIDSGRGAGSDARTNEFAAGYSLGLISSVRGWVSRVPSLIASTIRRFESFANATADGAQPPQSARVAPRERQRDGQRRRAESGRGPVWVNSHQAALRVDTRGQQGGREQVARDGGAEPIICAGGRFACVVDA